jgi:hypothetical protein
VDADCVPPTELRLLQSMAVARRPRCWLACHAAPLMRFSAPTALAGGGVHLRRARRRSGRHAASRACLTRYVPSSGFRPSRRFAPPMDHTPKRATRPPARRFSGGSAHGVPDPTELSPRPEPWRLSTPAAFLPFATRSRVARSDAPASMKRWGAIVRAGRVERDFKALLPGARALLRLRKSAAGSRVLRRAPGGRPHGP